MKTYVQWQGFDFALYLSSLGSYLLTVINGSRGLSAMGIPVFEELLRVVPRSLMLLGLAAAWALVLGFLAASIAIGTRRRSAATAS